MASRAFLAGISRVYFEYHYATQSGFVQDILEQLVEGPLALFRVVANPPTAYILQLLQHNRPTMSCGVVHYLFGHDVILILCTSRLFVANLVKQTVLPEALQVGFSSTPRFLGASGVKTKMQHFSILRVGESSNRSNRVSVYANVAC
jgi:hypothetical protein